jgi:hypothetical protein
MIFQVVAGIHSRIKKTAGAGFDINSMTACCAIWIVCVFSKLENDVFIQASRLVCCTLGKTGLE